MRVMKIRVPFAYFWYGDTNFGTPEVEYASIKEANPIPPQVPGAPRPSELQEKLREVEQLAHRAYDASHSQGRGR